MLCIKYTIIIILKQKYKVLLQGVIQNWKGEKLIKGWINLYKPQAGLPLKNLQPLQIPDNSCKSSCKFLPFSVVAGISIYIKSVYIYLIIIIYEPIEH